jgi:hypothetical protein
MRRSRRSPWRPRVWRGGWLHPWRGREPPEGALEALDLGLRHFGSFAEPGLVKREKLDAFGFVNPGHAGGERGTDGRGSFGGFLSESGRDGGGESHTGEGWR